MKTVRVFLRLSRRTDMDEKDSIDKIEARNMIENQMASRYTSHAIFLSRHAFLLWFLYMSCVSVFWSFSAAILPIGERNSNWSVRELYAIFAFIGTVYLIAFCINQYIYAYVNVANEKLVLGSILWMTIGCMLSTSLGIHRNLNTLPMIQAVFAALFLTFGFSIATLQIPAIYCNITGITQ